MKDDRCRGERETGHGKPFRYWKRKREEEGKSRQIEAREMGSYELVIL